MSRSGLTRLIERMEKESLVMREHSLEDRRVVYLEITSAGLDFVEQIGPGLSAAVGRATDGLSDADLKTLIHLLNQLGGAAQPAPESTFSAPQPME